MRELILIVDDNPMITEGLAMVLSRENRTVVTCNDVESAQMMVERHPFKAVVLDLQLSGNFSFEGFDFIGHVKRHIPDCVIVMMTGNHSEQVGEEAMRCGATRFLEKPFDIEQLEAFIPSSTVQTGVF